MQTSSVIHSFHSNANVLSPVILPPLYLSTDRFIKPHLRFDKRILIDSIIIWLDKIPCVCVCFLNTKRCATKQTTCTKVEFFQIAVDSLRKLSLAIVFMPGVNSIIFLNKVLPAFLMKRIPFFTEPAHSELQSQAQLLTFLPPRSCLILIILPLSSSRQILQWFVAGILPTLSDHFFFNRIIVSVEVNRQKDHEEMNFYL